VTYLIGSKKLSDGTTLRWGYWTPTERPNEKNYVIEIEAHQYDDELHLGNVPEQEAIELYNKISSHEDFHNALYNKNNFRAESRCTSSVALSSRLPSRP